MTGHIALVSWMLILFSINLYDTFSLDSTSNAITLAIISTATAILCLLFYLAYQWIIKVNFGNGFSLPVLSLPIFFFLSVIAFLFSDWFFGLEVRDTPDILGVIGNILKATLFAGAFFLSAIIVGKYAVFRLTEGIFSRSESAIIHMAIGTGIWGYVIFLLDVFGKADPKYAKILLIGILILSWQDIMAWLMRLARKEISISSVLGPKEAAFVGIFILSAIAFGRSLAGIAAAGWDTLHQYLTFPTTYFEHHSFVPFSFHPHWGFPQLAEMLFQAGLMTGDQETPFLFNYAFIAIGIIGFAIAARSIAPKFFVWPTAILASTPFLFNIQAGYLKVESLLFLYIVTLSIILLKAVPGNDMKPSSRIFVLIGIILGLLLSVKYTSVFIAASLLLSFLVFRKYTGFGWRQAALVAGTTLAVFSPWLIKNQLVYDSPLYPLLPGHDTISERLETDCHPYFMRVCREDIFVHLYPETFADRSDLFSRIRANIRLFLRGNMSPIMLVGPFFAIALPIGIWALLQRKNLRQRFLFTVSLAYLAMGILFFAGQSWYFLPAMVLFLLSVSFRIVAAETRAERLMHRLVIIWLLLIIAAFSFARMTPALNSYARHEITIEEFRRSLGNESEQQLSLYLMWQHVNELIRDSSDPDLLIYGFRDTQGYFIHDSYRHFIPDFYGYLFLCMEEHGGALEGMRRLGVDYILYDSNISGGCGIRDEFSICRSFEGFKKFIEENGVLIRSEGRIRLYAL